METPWDAYKGAPNPISSGIGAPQMHGVDFLLHLELAFLPSLHSFLWSASCRSEGKSVNHMRVTSGVEEARKGGREGAVRQFCRFCVRPSHFLLPPFPHYFLSADPASLPPSLPRHESAQGDATAFITCWTTLRSFSSNLARDGWRRPCRSAEVLPICPSLRGARASTKSERARAKNTTHVDGRGRGAARRRRPRSVTTSAEEMKSTAEERKEDGNANKHGRAFSAAAALRFPIFTIFCECENQEVTSSEQGASLPLCNHRRTRCSSVAWSWHFYLRANLRRIH